MRLLLTILIIAVIISSPCLGREIKVTEVIEVGPCGGPLYQPIKWSPDGSHIAFFRGKTLMMADTLGNQQEIYTIELTPRSFEWVSDTAIAFTQRDITAGRDKTYRLSVVTLSGVETVHENEQVARENSVSFSRIRKTASGAVYYRSEVKSANTIHLLSHSGNDKAETLSSHYDLKLVDGRVCNISLDDKDTMVVLPTAHSGLVASKDLNIIMTDGMDLSMFVYDILTKRCDTLVAPPELDSNELFCGPSEYDYDPDNDLVLFSIVCDERHGHHTDGIRICLYDRTAVVSQVLSPLTSSEFERSPMFSPNGNFFSFVADGLGAFIAKLEVN